MAQDPEEMMEDGGEEQSQPSSKSKLSLKTLILIGLPLVMVQGVLAYFIVKQWVEPKMPETKPRPEEVQEQDVRNEVVRGPEYLRAAHGRGRDCQPRGNRRAALLERELYDIRASAVRRNDWRSR